MLNRLDINREVARYLDDKQWRGLVTSRTQAAEEKRWRDAMGRKSKLRTYRTVKDKLVFEPYLNFDSRRTRILLTRLRSGTNFLRIEKGRYENEAIEDRVCYWCDKVEDERHFLWNAISITMFEIMSKRCGTKRLCRIRALRSGICWEG